MPRCLIIHATTEGQTRKVATCIAETLRAEGLEVRVHEGPETAPPPEGYDGVLLGGSIHVGKFQSSVTKWAKAHHGALADLHDGFFGVCMTAASDDPEKKNEVRGYVDSFMAATDWRPDRVAMFAGALAFTQYGVIKRWLMRAIASKGDPPITDTSHDYEFTNWEDVQGFARQFARDLKRERR
jgi:menaquinone-dependent protoporphyrinogen oxidase